LVDVENVVLHTGDDPAARDYVTSTDDTHRVGAGGLIKRLSGWRTPIRQQGHLGIISEPYAPNMSNIAPFQVEAPEYQSLFGCE
jgi:hypothetical protein